MINHDAEDTRPSEDKSGVLYRLDDKDDPLAELVRNRWREFTRMINELDTPQL